MNKILALYMTMGMTLVCLVTQSECSINIPDIWSSALAIGRGIASDVPNLLPTMRDMINASKQVLAGYPYALASNWINFICSEMMSIRAIRPKIIPDIDVMQFQLLTACGKRHSFPLLEADSILNHRAFDGRKRVVVLATGWLTTVNDTSTVDAFSRAFACRGDVNFLAVDAGQFVDTLYTWSALNTQEIGQQVAQGLALLAGGGVPVERMHLIGHSLGAHIMGAAGRHFFALTGRRVARITGLDPAKPCFNEGENLAGLQRGDADFIDVIHSNPGVLGKREPLGDADFYPGGLQPLPAGCLRITCAHARAWRYFVESVYPTHERNFMATQCSSIKSMRENKCPGKREPMGYAAPAHLKGNYFLEVHAKRPYGLEASSISPIANCAVPNCI